MCLVPEVKGVCQIPVGCSYRWLWATLGVLVIQARSSATAASALTTKQSLQPFELDFYYSLGVLVL